MAPVAVSVYPAELVIGLTSLLAGGEPAGPDAAGEVTSVVSLYGGEL